MLPFLCQHICSFPLSRGDYRCIHAQKRGEQAISYETFNLLACILTSCTACRLLRWGTSTAAELAAADDANANALLGTAQIGRQSGVVPQTEQTTGRPAAKLAARYKTVRITGRYSHVTAKMMCMRCGIPQCMCLLTRHDLMLSARQDICMNSNFWTIILQRWHAVINQTNQINTARDHCVSACSPFTRKVQSAQDVSAA